LYFVKYTTYENTFQIKILEQHHFYIFLSAPISMDQIKESAIGEHAACMGKMRNASKILVGNPERKETIWKSLA
jgi:hypothetical protein